MKKLILLIITIVFVFSCSTIPRSGFIDTGDDTRLHYRITGTGADTIVVADIGWGYPYIEEFGDSLTWIVYDVRDRGYSDNTDNMDLISMEHEIADMEKVRQYFKINKMNVLGWSYLGGMVALYAAKYPDHVNSIIQVGPIPFKIGEHWNNFIQDRISRADSALDNRVKQLQEQGIDKSDPQIYCKEFWKAGIAQIIADQKNLDRLTDNVPCDCENEWPQNLSIGQIIAKLGQWDWTEQIKTIQAKSLIIHGMADNIPLGSSEDWARLVPGSRIYKMNHSGHMPMAEEPDIFFDAVKKFIKNKTLGLESGFAEVNGTKLYYEVAGQREPLVLVHGNFGDCRHWDFNFNELAKKFKVIRYDVRGYGKSDSSPKGFEYADHDDLKALMDF
ncbi:MAG: alpha/beta hydrolase, partial [Mariniphaga sp.]|nr:alpha/beta hydrolase [Mariniphaga sp.]